MNTCRGRMPLTISSVCMRPWSLQREPRAADEAHTDEASTPIVRRFSSTGVRVARTAHDGTVRGIADGLGLLDRA